MARTPKSKQSMIIFYVLLAFVVLGLGGFGVRNFSGSIRSIGTVGDREIDVSTYSNALRQEIAAFSKQVGMQVTFAQAQAFGIDRSARAQVISMAALDSEAARVGLSVGDDRVRAALLAIPSFRDQSGNFDRLAYADVLKQNGLNEADFETQIRDESARTLLQAAIVGGVATPKPLADTLYAFVAETRGFSLIKLGAEALPAPVGAPDDAAIKAYYDTNPEAFTQPEAKRITYVKLLPEMLLDTLTVDEVELHKLYDERIAEFMQPERRLVERLAFANDAEAKAAKAAIDAGTKTFDTLVQARGLTLADIDLGDQAKDDLGLAGDAVFALAEPGVVGPFTSGLGPALFRMNGILAAQETTFDQARDQLVSELSMDQAGRQISAQVTDIDDRLAGGATMEELAAETEMELGTIDFFDGTEDPMAAYPAFRAAATALTAEDFPAVIALDNGGIAAMRLDQVVPPALKPLDAVRDAVIAAWTAAEIQARLLARAEEIKTAMAGGASAASLSLTPEVIAPMTRDGFIDGVPNTLVATVFKMAKTETRVIEATGMVYLVTLTDITLADRGPQAAGSEAATRRAEIEAKASQGIAQDVFEYFSQALESEAGISINETAVNAVHTQFQ